MPRIRIILALWLCAALTLTLARPATADPKGRGDRKLVREARRHKATGLAHLERGNSARAIEELQISYGLSRDPDVLFHLARAYNARQEYPQALYYYRSYRDSDPQGARRRRVDPIIDALEVLVVENPSPPTEGRPDQPPREQEPPTADQNGAPSPAVPPADETAADPSSASGARELPPPSDRAEDSGADGAGSEQRIAGLATASIGVAALGAGLYVASVGDRTADRYADGSEPWQDARDARRNGFILAGAGGAAIAAGAITYWLGRRESARARRVSVTAVPGVGAALSLAGAF